LDQNKSFKYFVRSDTDKLIGGSIKAAAAAACSQHCKSIMQSSFANLSCKAPTTSKPHKFQHKFPYRENRINGYLLVGKICPLGGVDRREF
jgi:hypothetical protein